MSEKEATVLDSGFALSEISALLEFASGTSKEITRNEVENMLSGIARLLKPISDNLLCIADEMQNESKSIKSC